MDETRRWTNRRYGLQPADDPLGLSLGQDGPKLGPIALLIKTKTGFSPRPTAELDWLFGRTFGQSVKCARLEPRLKVIADALNQGDVGRAMIATQQMRLEPLSAAEAARAAQAEALIKASPDDPAHPGWPAGTPGGRGGKFRPRDSSDSAVLSDMAQKQLRRLIMRRAIKAGLRMALKPGRVGRFAAEGLSNFVPVLDAVGDAAMAADLMESAAEASTLSSETKAALNFVKLGPRRLEDLQMSKDNIPFRSFDAFKKVELEKQFGPAGEGYEYHHIVEQGANGEALPPELLNSTRNIVKIPKLLHEEITSEFARKFGSGAARLSRRQALKGATFDERWREGVSVMREMHIIQ